MRPISFQNDHYVTLDLDALEQEARLARAHFIDSYELLTLTRIARAAAVWRQTKDGSPEGDHATVRLTTALIEAGL